MLKLSKEQNENLFYPLAKTLQKFNETGDSQHLAELIYQFISHVSSALFSDYFHHLSYTHQSTEIEDFLFQNPEVDLDFHIRLISFLISTHPIDQDYIHPNLKLLEMTFWEEVEHMRIFYRITQQGSYLISRQELKKCQKILLLSLERFKSFTCSPILLLQNGSCHLINGRYPKEVKTPEGLTDGVYFQKESGEYFSLEPAYNHKSKKFTSFRFLNQSRWKKEAPFEKAYIRFEQELQGKLSFEEITRHHPHYYLPYRIQAPIKSFIKGKDERLLCVGVAGMGKTALMTHFEKIGNIQNSIVLKYFVKHQTLWQSSSTFIRYFYQQIKMHLPEITLSPPEPEENLSLFFEDLLEEISDLDYPPIFILVDNLDEAYTPFLPEEESLFDLLCREFPEGFKIVAMSRTGFFGHSYLRDRTLELTPLSTRETQRFCKELDKDSGSRWKEYEKADGNPLLIKEMLKQNTNKWWELPGIESYFRELFIRYSNSQNIKILSNLVQPQNGISHHDLVSQSGLISPLVDRQIEKIRPLLQFSEKENSIRLFHPVFQEYLKQLLENLPFPKKSE